MVTVAACSACQRIKGSGDKDLRNLLTLDIQSSHLPDANVLRRNWFNKMSIRERICLQKTMDEARELELTNEERLVVGTALEFDFNPSRIYKSHEMAIRALYWMEHEEHLPWETPIFVNRVPWSIAGSFVAALSQKVAFHIRQKGKNVVWWCSFQLEEGDEFSTAWLICYFDQILLIGGTGSAAERLQSLEYQRGVLREARGATGVILPRRIVVPRNVDGTLAIPPA